MTTTGRLLLNQPVATDNVDVVTALHNQLERIDVVFDCFVCTSTTRPANLLFTGQMIFESDNVQVMYYDTTWKLFCHGRNPLGRLAFISSIAASSSVSGTQETGPYLSITFNARRNRQYAFQWCLTTDHVSGANTGSKWIVIRQNPGATVDQSSAILGRTIADVADNGTGLSVRQVGSGSFFPNIDGVITLGIFLQSTSGSNPVIINANSYHTFSLEDIGYKA